MPIDKYYWYRYNVSTREREGFMDRQGFGGFITRARLRKGMSLRETAEKLEQKQEKRLRRKKEKPRSR